MLKDFQKILVLAPHTDDGELGCGGTISKFLDDKKEVFLAVFSRAFVSKKFSPSPSIVLKELKESTRILGINPKNLIIYKFPLRHFSEKRQSILEKMLDLKKRINPDLVFMPSLNDIHQDHIVIAQEGLRAFKHTTILGYEDPWNNLTFNTTCFVHLDKKHVEKKAMAVAKYKSQSYRLYINKDFVMSLAYSRGIQIGTQYAEAFEAIRFIIS
jgi:LmbE family N-acetylglucosaminyl deacetylase